MPTPHPLTPTPTTSPAPHCGASAQLQDRPQTSLVVQWLRLRLSNAGGTGLIPGQGSSTYHRMWPKINTQKKRTVPLTTGQRGRTSPTHTPPLLSCWVRGQSSADPKASPNSAATPMHAHLAKSPWAVFVLVALAA